MQILILFFNRSFLLKLIRNNVCRYTTIAWKKIFNDVKFKIEKNVIFAHKVILVNRSLYCEKQFHESWTFEFKSNTNNKFVKLKDMTYAILKILIKYCYDDHLDWIVDIHVKKKWLVNNCWEARYIIRSSYSCQLIIDTWLASRRLSTSDSRHSILRSTRKCQANEKNN